MNKCPRRLFYGANCVICPIAAITAVSYTISSGSGFIKLAAFGLFFPAAVIFTFKVLSGKSKKSAQDTWEDSLLPSFTIFGLAILINFTIKEEITNYEIASTEARRVSRMYPKGELLWYIHTPQKKFIPLAFEYRIANASNDTDKLRSQVVIYRGFFGIYFGKKIE